MSRTQVAIVGGGLSGIYAALLLRQRNIDCVVLEARNRLGGRILSTPGPASSQPTGRPGVRHDLGPAWFWPEFQPRMAQLVVRLELSAFAQHVAGELIYERSLQGPAERHRHSSGEGPRSMRLAGGMLSLLEALAGQLHAHSVRLSTVVREIRHARAGHVELHTTGPAPQVIEAEQAILALPPRLAQEQITFAPALDAGVQQAWRATPTWMAGHAKALAVYAQPFWREAGLSGMASSQVGPLVEIHDASAQDGPPALFGFFGVPAGVRATAPPGALRAAVIAQLVRLFGPAAGQPASFWLQDWASEAHTATALDLIPPRGHPTYGFPREHQRLWAGRLLLAGTESAHVNGGYLEGALEAAEHAVAQV